MKERKKLEKTQTINLNNNKEVVYTTKCSELSVKYSATKFSLKTMNSKSQEWRPIRNAEGIKNPIPKRPAVVENPEKSALLQTLVLKLLQYLKTFPRGGSLTLIRGNLPAFKLKIWRIVFCSRYLWMVYLKSLKCITMVSNAQANHFNLLLPRGSCCSALLYYQAKRKARSRLNTRQKNWKVLVKLFLSDL